LGSVLGGMIALKIGVILARTGFPRWIIKGAKIDKYLSTIETIFFLSYSVLIGNVSIGLKPIDGIG
jgi:hypothetical protein